MEAKELDASACRENGYSYKVKPQGFYNDSKYPGASDGPA